MFQDNDEVKYIPTNEIGIITGRNRILNNKVFLQVRFNNGDVRFLPEEKLEKVEATLDITQLFSEGRFNSITDFRRALYKNRLSGDLTNILYSMDNTQTKFLAHQFIPVIKFLESYTQRLLIADEVGLGKTIESMYIWEELIARNNAKRLLIVVPAVLRYKWKKDLKEFFNIDAHIVSADNKSEENLLEHIENAIRNPLKESFSLIISLEGLRISSKISELIENNESLNNIFDLVIIDEAHYLRNSETKSFKMGVLLRDSTESMLLLSATPIQTDSENLYNLLNLLSPEDFDSKFMFDMQLLANKSLVKLTNALDRNSSKESIEEALDKLLEVYEDDELYKDIKRNLNKILKDPLLRIQKIEKLKDRYFYNNYITRTRKRDVIENRVERCINTIKFELTKYEKDFYDDVSGFLQNSIDYDDRLGIFRLIARQRQMASSLPAALSSWRNKVEEAEDALYVEEGDNDKFLMPAFEDVDLDKLKELDSKYNSFVVEIKKLIEKNPEEKIIVFSFYRDTIKYLQERMCDDDIKSIYIMGGLTLEEKNDRINAFQNEDFNVLISSEVGSEGIDLQFAKYEINYDLPWNPMRIEQRIGRIDRIGQESDKIYIYNSICQNTIEDEVLSRLYNRINVFKESLGDLEDILGKEIEALSFDIFANKSLINEEERQKRIETCLANIQANQDKLELKAGNLSMYQSFVMDSINVAQSNKRFITPNELRNIVTDFLNSYFIGSTVTDNRYEGCANIKLSDEARDELSAYIRANHCTINTNLTYDKAVCCRFYSNPEKKVVNRYGYIEDIDINHPLVRWIISVIKNDQKFGVGCSCLYLSKKNLQNRVSKGVYSFYISQLIVNGVKKTNELHYVLCNSEKLEKIYEGNEAENILISALQYGETYDSNLITDNMFNKCLDAMENCFTKSDDNFSALANDFDIKNQAVIKEQENYINKIAAYKINKIEETISKIKDNYNFDYKKKESIIKMHRGRADKVSREKEDKIRRLREKMDCNPELLDIAVGILVIGD